MALSFSEASLSLTYAARIQATEHGWTPYARRVVVTGRCPGIRASSDQRKIYVSPFLLTADTQLTTIRDIADIAYRIDVTRELTSSGWWDLITAGRLP